MKKTPLEKASIFILSVIIAAVSVFPFLWVLFTSFKTTEQIYAVDQFFPKSITLENYERVLFHSHFLRYFLNSAIVSSVVTVVSMVLAIMAAYGFTRYNIIGGQKIKLGILFTKMFPGILLSIPYYVIMKKIGLINTHAGLMILNCSFALPFAIWNMCAFFLQIPWEVEESALIDGCTRFTSFFHVVFPVAKPGIMATTLYCFLQSWDEYMYANIFIDTQIKKTVQVGIRDFIGEYATEWGPLMASVILSLIPVLIFFALVQDKLVGGLTAGAVKG